MAVSVLLRVPSAADAALLTPLWMDGLTRRYLGGPCTPTVARERFQHTVGHWEAHGFGLWVVEADRRCAGLCGCQVMEGGDSTIELVYELFAWSWGQGIATTASRRALDALPSSVREVVAMTQAANIRSQRVLDRLGFAHAHNLMQFGELQRWYVLDREGTSGASG